MMGRKRHQLQLQQQQQQTATNTRLVSYPCKLNKIDISLQKNIDCLSFLNAYQNEV